MDKKSVLLYLDSLNVLDSLTDEQAGKLIKKIRAYSAGLEYDPKEQLIDVVFVQFKNYIDVNTEKYNGICEKNKDNVRKRWDKENTTVYDRIPLDTKHTDKDTDKDNDNVNNIVVCLQENGWLEQLLPSIDIEWLKLEIQIMLEWSASKKKPIQKRKNFVRNWFIKDGVLKHYQKVKPKKTEPDREYERTRPIGVSQ